MHGVLVVDKPEGMTSFDVVAQVRRLLKVKKVGHTGTLDPMATGVLPVCVGDATRLAAYLTEGDKAYEATLRLGSATDTQDRTGQVIAEAPVPALDAAALEAALARFRGAIDQAPPMYSAVRVDGRRLYELAREGVEIERAARRVHIHALELLGVELPELRLRVACSKGTYVRTLAHELGIALGTYAHLTALRRTRSAGFSLEQSLPLTELATLPREAIGARLVGGREALGFLPELTVDAALARRVLCGQRLGAGDLPELGALAEGQRARVASQAGELLAVAEVRSGALHYLRVLAGPAARDP